jgi:hypothetical protein
MMKREGTTTKKRTSTAFTHNFSFVYLLRNPYFNTPVSLYIQPNLDASLCNAQPTDFACGDG